MNKDQETVAQHTVKFAQAVRDFGKRLPVTVANVEDIKELFKASGAIGASFIQAHEASSKHDFLTHLKMCSRESSSTNYWLQLVDTMGDQALEHQRNVLMQVSEELHQVFLTMIQSTIKG